MVDVVRSQPAASTMRSRRTRGAWAGAANPHGKAAAPPRARRRHTRARAWGSEARGARRRGQPPTTTLGSREPSHSSLRALDGTTGHEMRPPAASRADAAHLTETQTRGEVHRPAGGVSSSTRYGSAGRNDDLKALRRRETASSTTTESSVLTSASTSPASSIRAPPEPSGEVPLAAIFLILLAVRVLNALATRTFFQPDEYWQSLEVAHRSVFGFGYLTWEWRTASDGSSPLRSFAHPLVFVPGYWILRVLRLDDTFLLVRYSRARRQTFGLPLSHLSASRLVSSKRCSPH